MVGQHLQITRKILLMVAAFPKRVEREHQDQAKEEEEEVIKPVTEVLFLCNRDWFKNLYWEIKCRTVFFIDFFYTSVGPFFSALSQLLQHAVIIFGLLLFFKRHIYE